MINKQINGQYLHTFVRAIGFLTEKFNFLTQGKVRTIHFCTLGMNKCEKIPFKNFLENSYTFIRVIQCLEHDFLLRFLIFSHLGNICQLLARKIKRGTKKD